MKTNQDVARDLRCILDKSLADASRQLDYESSNNQPSSYYSDAIIVSKSDTIGALTISILPAIIVGVPLYFLIAYLFDSEFYAILIASLIGGLSYGAAVMRYMISHHSENAYVLAKDHAWAHRYMDIYQSMLQSIEDNYKGSTPDLSFSTGFMSNQRHEFVDRAIGYTIPPNEYPYVSSFASKEFSTRRDKEKNKYQFNIQEDQHFLAAEKAKQVSSGRQEPPLVRR